MTIQFRSGLLTSLRSDLRTMRVYFQGDVAIQNSVFIISDLTTTKFYALHAQSTAYCKGHSFRIRSEAELNGQGPKLGPDSYQTIACTF